MDGFLGRGISSSETGGNEEGRDLRIRGGIVKVTAMPSRLVGGKGRGQGSVWALESTSCSNTYWLCQSKVGRGRGSWRVGTPEGRRQEHTWSPQEEKRLSSGNEGAPQGLVVDGDFSPW